MLTKEMIAKIEAILRTGKGTRVELAIEHGEVVIVEVKRKKVI